LQNVFKNNLIYSSMTANTIYYGHSPTYPSGTTYTVAMFNAANGTEGDEISGNIAADPLFVSSNDFHLQSGSPARQAGITGLSSTDYDNAAWGSPLTIGAYEYGTYTPPTGVPDTTNFSLQDVCDVIHPSSNTLATCFAEANSGLFDPSYEGDKNSLLNFRNYNG
jgi:hypothetical protein